MAQPARQNWPWTSLSPLPPDVGAAAVANMAFAFPQVEPEIGEWIERHATAIEEAVRTGEKVETSHDRVANNNLMKISEFYAHGRLHNCP